nr:unnamed protein product [Callosobruchus chinensis]
MIKPISSCGMTIKAHQKLQPVYGLGEEVKEVDTVSEQNRSCINVAMFLRAVHLLTIKTMNQKFMESEPSEMECDGVYSSIENHGNKIDTYTPEGTCHKKYTAFVEL